MNMQLRGGNVATLGMIVLLSMSGAARAGNKNWKAATSGDWFTGSNWAEGSIPEAGDVVVISSSGSVISLTNATPELSSFRLSAGTLVFSNWLTRVSATNVTVNGGKVTVANAFAEGQMSNRVWFVCANDFTLTNGSIDVNGLGYAEFGGPGSPGQALTSTYFDGGGHGGKGGVSYLGEGSPVNDSLTEPELAGSSSGGYTNTAGAIVGCGKGGGVVLIEAGGTATISGTIAANGAYDAATSLSGGGAGGSIRVVAGQFAGSAKGLLQADGGRAGSTNYGGGGGGGRIAVTGGSVSVPLLCRFSTRPGLGRGTLTSYDAQQGLVAGWGTVYVADTNVLAGLPQSGQFTETVLHVGSATNWAVSQLTVISNSFRLGPEGFQIAVGGDLIVGTNAHLGVMGSIACGGDLVLTNGGKLSVFSGPTNAAGPSYGALVNVAGDLLISQSSWLQPHSDPTNGGSVRLCMQNLLITGTNSGINASGRGFAEAQGPGKGKTGPASGYYGTGGGYGGKGGNSVHNLGGGAAYGSAFAPLAPGSGGGICDVYKYGSKTGSGYGGGLIRVEAARDVTIEGMLIADGGPGYSAWIYGAGGSGGGIQVACRRFSGGANALLSARGGNAGYGSAGGGGGGRIAVWHGVVTPQQAQQAAAGSTLHTQITETLASYQGSATATNAVTSYAPPLPGTVNFIGMPPPGTLLTLE